MEKTYYTKIALPSYLSTVPLIAGLEENDALKFFRAAPAAMVNMLEMKKVDLALIPSIDYQLAHGDLKILRGSAVGTLDTCAAACLYSKKPLRDITTIACDIESHTAIVLAHVILREFYSRQPQTIRFDYSTKQIPTADAILLVGDKNFSPDLPAEFMTRQIDLAHTWHKNTGLGFVFAVWACRRGFKAQEFTSMFILNYKKHLKHLDLLGAQYAPLHNYTPDAALSHLAEMHYPLDAEQVKSLRFFYSLAHKHKLIRRQRMIFFAT
ncbi:MAG: hypothetical protein A2Y07_10300 [Planctomycetes bacterium GWF2_50_10]|nr:MAG: hypothetical protein A2Y07_10300 [Planctomycetes bacterium GWF2_50_10]